MRMTIIIAAVLVLMSCGGKKEEKTLNTPSANSPTLKTHSLLSFSGMEMSLKPLPDWHYLLTISNKQGILLTNTLKLSRRPVSYFLDDRYLVLLSDGEPGETDPNGYYAPTAFVVYDIRTQSLRRYPENGYEVGNFKVIDAKIYAGIHLTESPNGQLIVIDLASGETGYVSTIIKQNQTNRIEAWAPQAGLNEQGKIVVMLSEGDAEKIYTIQSNVLRAAPVSGFKWYVNPQLQLE